jgi:hypothetical protein
MYLTVLGLHNVVRWVVVLTGAWIVLRAVRGWLQGATWSSSDASAARWFVLALDIQFTLGILLYAGVSPKMREALRDMGTAMKDPSVRQFAVEHTGAMVIAIVVAHIVNARLKRATVNSAKFKIATLGFGIALAAILGFIPWARPLIPSF